MLKVQNPIGGIGTKTANSIRELLFRNAVGDRILIFVMNVKILSGLYCIKQLWYSKFGLKEDSS